MQSSTRRLGALLVGLVAAVALVACGDDDAPTTADPDTEPAETSAAESEPLRILVANDDGIDSQGLDLLVRTLEELPNVEITVVAPAEDQSGTSDQTTPEGAPHTPATTASGIEATAVDGFPADAVFVALDELGLEPHLVVSGINDGHNIGPFAELSGTVGVARTALRRGIPGVAVSAGLEYDDAEFGVGADLVAEWITEHRDALVDGTQPTDLAVSFNVPTCPVDQMGDVVEVPLADDFLEGHDPFESECTLDDPDPIHDHAALVAGYPALTMIPAEL